MRAVVVLLSIALVGCASSPRPIAPRSTMPPRASSIAVEPRASPVVTEPLLPDFRITNYTLARESELSGQRTGNRQRIKARGLPGQYAWEFLCSGRGVAMQGTGVSDDGQFIRYVRGGGGFCGRDKSLCNCKSAQFAVTDGVYGSSGRSLVENYSIAVDPAVIPLGSYVWIDAMKRWFRADDTGGAIDGRHIDVYVGTQPFVFNGMSSIYVTSEPHQPEDPGPASADTSCDREGLVCGGDGYPGERSILYRCRDGRLTFARACSFGCRRARGNGDDACNPRPPMLYCSSEGVFCGGDRVDGSLGALYRCSEHGLRVESVCPHGCVVDPDGLADRCL